jgi:aminopeptidase N
MGHHAFSLSNPNRVRSLIGGFSANQTQFNRADGAGYDLLAEIVLTLDPTNPQIAARLLSALRSWRSLELRRQSKAEAALAGIAAKTQLSADVRDIVTRCLS